MKLRIDFQRPFFILIAATFVLMAIATADSAHAQNATGKVGLLLNSTAYVTTDKLNIRSQPSTTADVVIGALERGDEVKIVDLLTSATPLVRIQIVRSDVANNSMAAQLFVSAEYLSAVNTGSASAGPSKYIVIQNIATERMRIYERCTTSPGCPNRMVMETEMVVGKKTDKANFLTWVGRYKITEWVKFYQDNADHYPSWYDPNYPMPPKPGSGGGSWMSGKFMPGGHGTMRGAFGWYAAMLAPNANYQWIHGTIGWGSDGTKFIEMTRDTMLNFFANPRSSGCTRLENRAVAFTRDLLPPGTEVLRIYAKEAYRDVSRARYQAQAQPKAWEFILTKEGVRKSGAATSEKNAVLARGVTEDLILETGSYAVDQYPNGMPLKEDAGWGSRVKGKSGNTYNIKDEAFRGVFLIDEGTFIDYNHPAGLERGGYEGAAIPASLQTSGSFTLVNKNNK